MKNQRTSIDGLVPRSPGNNIGNLHNQKTRAKASSPTGLSRSRVSSPGMSTGSTGLRSSVSGGGIHTGARKSVGRPVSSKRSSLTKSSAGDPQREDILDSLEGLSGIDTVADTPKKSRFSKKRDAKGRKGAKKPKSKARRIAKWTGIALLVAVIAIAGYLVIKGIIAGNNMLGGNILDAITKNEPLKEDENGRSNFLVFGTAEDSEGGNHGGAHLTDSIMVLSVNQTKKDAYMLSLPRDLWVQYQEACTVGYQGKLNATYFCGSNQGEDEKAGGDALAKKVGEITGLDIQYRIHLNFTAVIEAVDAVGGVDVTIESSDPRGILDRNFDWRCNYTCYYVNYKNGEKVHLDGEHALALARARNASGGYGVSDNFGREKNQQIIIKALREKALSAGTLSNLGSVTGLIDALGNNLRTNIDAKEIRTIMSLASDIQTDNIISLSLNDEDNMLVTTGNLSGQSIVRPVAGLMDYSEIRSYVKTSMTSEPFIKEAANVNVLNGSGVAGVAQSEADKLSDEGFKISSVGNAPKDDYQTTVIYQISSSKTATAAKLESIYGVKVNTGTPPVSVVGDTHFVVVIGKDKASSSR